MNLNLHGAATIYQIEKQLASRAWTIPVLPPSAFGERHANEGENEKKVSPLHYEYGPDGKCFERTWLYGFTNETIAERAFDAIIAHHPPTIRWRLVKRRIHIDTFPVREGRGLMA